MRSRLRQVKLIYCVYFLLAFVLSMGIAGIVWSPDGEFFPFASFSLFSVVPNVRVAYAIEIHDLHGRPVDPPLLWVHPDKASAEPTSSEPFYAIQRFGSAFVKGHYDDAEYWRHLLEEDFLSPPVRYELVQVRYDPFERLSSGRLRQEQILASFTAER